MYRKKATVLFIAVLILSFSAYAYASDSGADKELLSAATRGDTALAASSLALGADPDSRDRLGNTPLILASDAGYQEIVRLLIDHHASINTINKFGYTPLLSAVTGGHRFIASLLVKAGADPKIPNKYGTTAEDYIRVKGFFTIVEYVGGTEPVITTIVDDRNPRRGELGALHNNPWREKFNKLISENKSAEAAEYLVIAASDNNDEAAYLLGALLIERNNVAKGIEWLKKALKSIDPEILYNAAKSLLDSGEITEAATANVALKRSADKGNLSAKTLYAKNLLLGLGININNDEAYQIFTQMAAQDIPEAIYYKGYMEYAGLGVKKDEQKAMDTILKAADMGYLDAAIFIDKRETDGLLKNIASYLSKDPNYLKTYFPSVGAVLLPSENGCDVYDLSSTFTSAYKIVKSEICNKGTKLNFYLSPLADKNEIEYLKNISGGANFIMEQNK